jgi:hypothetical protein
MWSCRRTLTLVRGRSAASGARQGLCGARPVVQNQSKHRELLSSALLSVEGRRAARRYGEPAAKRRSLHPTDALHQRG